MLDEFGNKRFFGVYRGVVIDNLDPLNKGRIRVKVPQVLLDEVTGWAWAIHQPGVLRLTPPVGEGVFVMFEGGDPSFPIWLGTFTPLSISYGSFYDTTAQTAVAINTAYAIKMNTVDQASNVTIVDNTKITIANPGTYNLQWSGQFKNTDSQAHDVRVWLRYNGVNYPQSASVMSIPSSHGGIPGHVIAAWNWVGTSQAPGDYVEIVWSTESTSVSLEVYAANTAPAVPSVIVTLTQVK
jgi:hypothetical protein